MEKTLPLPLSFGKKKAWQRKPVWDCHLAASATPRATQKQK
jgi:hypothetical protein